MTTTISYAYKAVAHYMWPSSSSSASSSHPEGVQPVITQLPAKTNNIHFWSGYNLMAAYLPESQEIKLYDCSNGTLKHTFKCDSHVTSMHDNYGVLFAHLGEEGPIQAWEIGSGNPVSLPSVWQKVSNLFTVDYLILATPAPVDNGTLSLTLCDRHKFTPIKTLPTEFFKIHDATNKMSRLFITGIASNPACKEAPSNGFIRVYDDILTDNVQEYQLNYPYDSSVVKPHNLKTSASFIYHDVWTPTHSVVWDLNTLAPVLARKAEKNADEATLTGVIDFTLVVVDRKEIAVYEAIGEVDTELPCFRMCQKELSLEQSFGTKTLSKARTIACASGNQIKSLHLFKLSEEPVMAEGYENGKVIIRNLKTLNAMMEFTPPGNMKNVCTLKTNYYGDKLIVHYATPSQDGTLGIVWDTKQQKPLQYITRDALKNRAYDSSQDTISYKSYQEDLIIHSEDQVLFYKGIMKSQK